MNLSEKKAVFFDIDGTLWDFENRIPASTAEAIRRLRAAGHFAFLCSGRCRAFIQNPDLLALGFDGIISGCGTMIEYNDDVLFYHRIDPTLAIDAVQTVRAYGFRPILEGRDYLYFDDSEFAGDPYGEKLIRELGSRRRTIADHWGVWETSKLSCDTRGGDQAGCFSALAGKFDPIVHSFAVVELVPAGFDKGEGIQKLCVMLGLVKENTIAFGDSVNDLGMFAACGRSVAMGNGAQAAKDAATFVTTSMTEDGVWNGCRALELF